jgi:3-methyladenine DNA glycosylase Tag
MPRSGPQGVDPTEIFPFKFGETPVDERAYFAALSWFVFGSGLNWRVLKMKWPAFVEAFAAFDPATVAAYGDRDIDRLLANAGIIRNGRKIVGTIENARQLREIATESGGMTAWLRGFGTDVDGLTRAVKKRFSHMGEVTTRMFLSAVGAIEYSTWEPTTRQRAGRP